MAEIEFLTPNVPALGYQIYRIEPTEGSFQTPQWHPLKGDVSNKFFALDVDPATGSISKLVDRRTGRELLSSGRYGGNELVLEEEKNPNMEGMIHFTGSEVRASSSRPKSVTVLADELGATVRIEGSFLGGERLQEIKIYEQLPRIDFRTELKGLHGHDGILTVVFPMSSRTSPNSVYETHNAVVERPDGIYEAHTWTDFGSSDGGLAILNQGTGGHQINDTETRLILLRSVTNYQGYHTPEASENGDHVFEYSLYPHSGGWSESGVMEQAHSFNSPLRVIPTDAHRGSLPVERSFLSIQSGHFEITALKKAEDGDDLILRGHETHGKAGRVRLHVDLPVQRVWLSNLLEQPGPASAVRQGDIEFDCHPFEFVTLRMRLRPDTHRQATVRTP
jgi:alpha-mannosidase